MMKQRNKKNIGGRFLALGEDIIPQRFLLFTSMFNVLDHFFIFWRTFS